MDQSHVESRIPLSANMIDGRCRKLIENWFNWLIQIKFISRHLLAVLLLGFSGKNCGVSELKAFDDSKLSTKVLLGQFLSSKSLILDVRQLVKLN